MSIRLSRAEVWEVLADAHTGIFTSLRADGVPIALPVWFVAFNEHVYIDSVSRLKKVARVRRDPRVSFLVESGHRRSELRGIHLTGVAKIVTEPFMCNRDAGDRGSSDVAVGNQERGRDLAEHADPMTDVHEI